MAEPNTERSAVTESVQDFVDKACDQFEQQWREGRRPRIEDFVAGAPTSIRMPLLRELLASELELRRKGGDAVEPSEYRRRFPHQDAMIDGLFAASPTAAESTLTPRPTDALDDSVATSTRLVEMRFFKSGGLGTLYQATDEQLHRDTVIKFINTACMDDPSMVTQFRVEAEITGRLDHPGVVPVYGIGQDWYGRPFYVMRLIKGNELRQAIQEYHHAGGPSDRSSVSRQRLFNLLEHLVSACNTVAYAHDVGIVHCDIKPANIMIGKYGETLVLDWGLARSFERSTTFHRPNEPTMRPSAVQSGSDSANRGGTYGYISPEQLTSEDAILPASDVYSLGATLYEILTGRAPFTGRDADVVDRIREGNFRKPTEVNRDVPRRLEAVCLKAMSLKPDDRYTTAKHLAADIQNWLRDEEVHACRDTLVGKVFRWARRHRSATIAALVVTVIGAAAGVWIYLSYLHASHEAQLRQMAEVNFNTALDTFEDLCRPLANNELNNLAIFRPFASRIDGFTNEYLRQYKTNADMRPYTARMYELRATVAGILRADSSGPLRDMAEAEQIYEALDSEDGHANGHRLRLARNHLAQGRLLTSEKQFAAAQHQLNSAESTLEEMIRRQPNDESLQRTLAEIYHSLGENFLVQESELDEAKRYLLKSKDLREQLQASPNTPVADKRAYKRDLGRSLGYLGDLLLAQGKVTEAAEEYEESRKLRLDLFRESPTDPEHRFQYARGLTNFGFLDRDYRGHWDESIALLTEAEQIQSRLVTDFPDVMNFRLDYGGTLNMLAETYLLASVDRPSESAALAQKAGELAGKGATLWGQLPANERRSQGLATSLALQAILERSGDAQESALKARDAAKELRELGSMPQLDRDALFTLAMSQALQHKPDEALTTLETMAAKGGNAAIRLEKHATLAFASITADPALKARFEALVMQLKSRLTE